MTRNQVSIGPASDAEREWGAVLMAGSEPWLTLRRRIEACRHAFWEPGNLIFIARDAGDPCGFLILQPRGLAGAPYLRSLAVAPAWRGGGVGAALVGFAEDYCRDAARFLFLCVSSFNPRARRFYERLGYTPVGELKDFVIAGASEWLMSKRLGD